MARPAIPYIPDDSPGEYKFDDKNPGHWEYHIRVKHEKEEMEYEDSKANQICQRVAGGEFLINILKDEDLPTVRRCHQWLTEHMDFKVYYDDPLNDRLLIFEDETIPDAAAKNTEEVLQKDGTTREMLDPTKISAAKLQTEVRFRHLRACKPQKWGDSSTLITKSADEEKLDALTIDELEEKISKFIYKDQVLKAK